MQERVELVFHERPEDENPPETDHNTRNRGEHLHKRADHAAHATGRKLAEEERDRNRQRRGDENRDERRERRPVDEVECAEMVPDRIPGTR